MHESNIYIYYTEYILIETPYCNSTIGVIPYSAYQPIGVHPGVLNQRSRRSVCQVELQEAASIYNVLVHFKIPASCIGETQSNIPTW